MPSTLPDEAAPSEEPQRFRRHGLAQNAFWEPEGSAESLTLSQALERADITISTLGELLGVDTPTALDMWRDDVQPTVEQLAILDRAAAERGADALPSEATAPSLPAELLREMVQPRWKTRFLTSAADHDASEADERRAKALEAVGLTLAARSTPSQTPDWEEVLDRVLP